MKKNILCLLSGMLLFVSFTAYGQDKERSAQTVGNCSSYVVNGNRVIFSCENQTKVLLQVCGPEVLKIWVSPTGTFKRNNESFAVINEKIGDQVPVNVSAGSSAYEITTPKLRVRVNKSPFRLQVFNKDQKLLFSDYKDRGFVKEDKRLIAYKTLGADEHFFGLGEKAGTLDRRGRSYKMWNSDQPCYGVNEDPLYKSIPFFMSSRMYGIFFDNTYKTEFKFGTESDDYYSFEAPGGEMIYYFMGGGDYKEIISNYIALTGKPIMPPDWALGFSQCRGLYTNEKLARDIASEFRKRKIPCDVIYQDIGWVEGLQNFEWRKDNYTNPGQMVKDLGNMGFKMIVSQDPVISQATKKQWHEADSLHYFTTDIRTGKTYDMPWPWGGNCGVVDFTRPEVADWWGNYQQKVLDDGVKGFWTDMGEPAWSNEDATERLYMKHYLGMHDEIHNVYGLTWDKVVKEQFDKHNPNRRIFQMTRSAYAGLQRYTFGWSGDSGNGDNVLEGWSRLANQIPVGLSAGMGEIPFWTCDISGYCGDIKDHAAMAELYTRWMQFGIFNPLSRAHHEGNNAAEPWTFGPEAEKLCRQAIELKYRLFPYIYTYAREAHDTGLPLMRAVFLEYPHDPEAFHINEEFLFGKELLVAPVVEKGAVTKDVYLPEGEWIDYNNGRTVYKGSQHITYKAPLNVIPLFVKKGSIIPTMPVMQYIHEKASYPLSLDIFPASAGKEALFNLYEDDGESNNYLKDVYCKTKINCLTGKKDYVVRISRDEKGYKPSGPRNFIIRIHSGARPESVTVNSAKPEKTGPEAFRSLADTDFKKLAWSWDEKEGVVCVKVPDTGVENEIRVSR